MERETVSENNAKLEEIDEKVRKKANEDGGLSMALWNAAVNRYNDNMYDDLWKRLTKIYGKSPKRLDSVEEFWNPELKSAVVFLAGEERQADIEEITHMYMEWQFSHSMYRRSYRSKNFWYYAAEMVSALCNWIYWTVYDKSVREMLYYELDWRVRGYTEYLALELKRNNKEVVELVRESLLGDNQTIPLSTTIIRAIILSGNDEILDILIKLLLAARLQEGLRQQILENADAGNIHVLMKILKVCIDEDMFRYSSAVRALNTWTGLGYSDEKPAVVKKCANLAYECLNDEGKRSTYLNSNDNLEAYFAVWAAGCHEIDSADQMVENLLKSDKKYRKVLGWYFVSHADNSYYQMKMAEQYLEERDEELLAWIVSNLSVTYNLTYAWYYDNKESDNHAIENSDLPDTLEERKKLFHKLKDILLYVGNKKSTFTGNPFPFSYIELDSSRVISCMLSVAGYDMNEELIQEFLSMYYDESGEEKSILTAFMSVNQRRAFYFHYLHPAKNAAHKKYILEALKDRSIQIKELAVHKLSDCDLKENDLSMLSDSLRSKSSSLRKCILDIFKKLPVDKLSLVMPKMLTSEEEYQIQAGIELLIEKKNKYPDFIQEQSSYLEKLKEKKLSTQTEILFKQLFQQKDEQSDIYTLENGFGLYNPECIKLAMQAEDTDKADIYTEEELKKMLILSGEEYFEIFNRMNSVFEKHADYEYTVLDYDGSRRTVLFGNISRNYVELPEEFGNFQTVREKRTFSMIPFYEEFIEALGEYAKETEKMLCLCYMSKNWVYDHSYGAAYQTASWFEKIEKTGLTDVHHTTGYEMYGMRYWQMVEMIELLPGMKDSREVFNLAFKLYRSMIALVGEDNLGKSCIEKEEQSGYYFYYSPHFAINHRMLGIWRELIKKSVTDSEDFKMWFTEEYRIQMMAEEQMKQSSEADKYSQSYDMIYWPLTMEDYFRAYDEQIISKDIMYHFLLSNSSAIRLLTNTGKWAQGRKIFEQYSWSEELVKQAVIRIVEVEEKRGEIQTPLTKVAVDIGRFEGAKYFVHLLAALGKDNFFRGYYYSSDNTKQAVLSMLLKRCYPAKEDTPEVLEAYLKETDIKEKRLVEAVMYAPQWAGFAEKILGWKGLKCAVWFFHAHVNESFSAEKETEVAIYSPITPEQFNDGSFDRDWFFQAYEQLGEKRFSVLYKSAKYITAGSNQHRRSQLYSDAVLGKLDIKTLQAEIEDKRNQEKLRCYPLIPFTDNQPGEALRRYEFIEKFRKESKQFGAQRRESEKKACDTAIQNLAITTGFMDVNRMMWYLESEKMEEIRPFMEPVEVENGIIVHLEFGDDGVAELVVVKNGKRQKTLPKSLNKHEYILEIKAKVKELKEQRRRSKVSLERAMVESTEFGSEEIEKICSNPVLYPMIRYLVWTDGSRIGFITSGDNGIYLNDVVASNCEEVKQDEKLRIAHPYNLMQSGKWAEYMHFLYENKIVQPFKQVFREYYPITEDERQEKNISRRYAGHQVQPQKTVALLRGCGWTVDYEEGLQKVFYKENLIARVYAMADWFSPADIEAPTLETIHFYDRKTGECVDFAEVPPILFSETMRDVDLAVSVAHVGGVDPEASQSTTQMRVAIAKELVQLLRLQNVSFLDTHAKIKGTLGNYSVHMGSGVVHAEAVGMIAILPVHSQARGRIFLPFADDDPRTAEIMSKIILLAEDQKIKDTSILKQIRGN